MWVPLNQAASYTHLPYSGREPAFPKKGRERQQPSHRPVIHNNNLRSPLQIDFILTPSLTGFTEALQGLRYRHTLWGFIGVFWNLGASVHGALPPLQLPPWGFIGIFWNLGASIHGALPPLQLPHGRCQLLLTTEMLLNPLDHGWGASGCWGG